MYSAAAKGDNAEGVRSRGDFPGGMANSHVAVSPLNEGLERYLQFMHKPLYAVFFIQVWSLEKLFWR